MDKRHYNGVPVFMKDSLIPIIGKENMRRDFPKQLQHSEISPKLKAKLYAECAACKVTLRKNEMITLLARPRRGEQPKQFGFKCVKNLDLISPTLQNLWIH